jgi:hypothetical protein
MGELLVLFGLSADYLATSDRPNECREVAPLPPLVA